MPYPQEHSCRLSPPENYDKFRRGKRKHEGKEYSVIYGKLKDEDKWEDQAFRYDKEVWDADDAKTHCKDHDGKFEAADGKAGRVISAANIIKLRAAMSAIQALLEASEAEDEPEKSTQLDEIAIEAARLDEIINSLKAETNGFDTKEAEKRIDAILEKLKKGDQAHGQ